MSANELYIQGRLIEIPESEVVALSKQVNDIGDLNARKMNLSNDIRVPYFAKNDQHINFAGDPTSTSRYPYNFLPATLKNNGVEIVRNGRALLKATAEDQATITLYWGNSDFFERLNFMLHNIDFSELNHIYSIESVKNLYDTTDGKVFYAFNKLMNQNISGSFEPVLRLEKTFASISVPYIVNRIMEKTGYQLEGEILSNDAYTSLAIQLQDATFQPVNVDDLLVEASFLYNTVNEKFEFSDIVSDGGDPDSFPDLIRYVNKSLLAGDFRLEITLGIILFNQPGVVFQIIRNGTEVVENYSFPATSLSQTVLKRDILLMPNDELTLNLILPPGFEAAADTFSFCNFKTLDIQVGQEIPTGVSIIQDQIPEITARDFLKMIANIFGLVFVPGTDRIIHLKSYKTLQQSKTDRITYTYYIDPRSIETTFRLDGYFQNSIIGYEDGRFNFASTFQIENNTLSDEGVVVQIPAYLPRGTGETSMAEIGLFNEDGEKQKLPMILYNHRVLNQSDLQGTWSLTDGTLTDAFEKIVLGDTEGIKPDRMISDYYAPIIKILGKYRQVTLKTLINVQQFFEIDTYRAYYFPELQRYAQIQKVSNFVEGQMTTLTLILL